MSETFDHQTITRNGRTYRVEYVYDHDSGEPWTNSDGHGIVTGWETRDANGGERILSTDHGAHRFYDLAGSLELAKDDKWGTPDGRRDGESAEDYAARAVELDFAFLHAWCRDEWHYCFVDATLLDNEGKPTTFTDSMGGVETWEDYHLKGATDQMIEGIEGQLTTARVTLTPRIDPDADVNWRNDAIQFPRLLAEIHAGMGDSDGARLLKTLRASMDLTNDQIAELFDRATETWDSIKARTTNDSK